MKTPYSNSDSLELENVTQRLSSMNTSPISQSNQVIESLIGKTKQDKSFTELLLASLQKAKLIAKEELSSDLFDALQWPLNIEDYKTYLISLSKWMPEECDDDVWKTPGTKSHQEVDERLNHFHWLINQKVGENDSTIIQNINWFSKWLVDYANCWGSFLNTTDSFNQNTLDSFINNSPKYRVQDSIIAGLPNNPSGWLKESVVFKKLPQQLA